MSDEEWLEKEFDRLTVKSRSGNRNGNKLWRCECKCGNIVFATSSHLKTGFVRSCGCLKRERTRERRLTHGQSGSSEYWIWAAMIQRCTNPNYEAYQDYGERGIGVCDRWFMFKNFIDDMGQRPSKAHTLERKDNDSDYCPENCVWATRVEQANNRRTTKRVEYRGNSYTIRELSEKTGVKLSILRDRIKRGWTIEDAVGRPPRTWPSST